jgi:hypothetical protein
MVSYRESARVLGESIGEIASHTLDLPEPESPIVTILLMKLYGWVGWAMAAAEIPWPSFRDMRALSTGFSNGMEGDTSVQFPEL